jgi:hypothetical protein
MVALATQAMRVAVTGTVTVHEAVELRSLDLDLPREGVAAFK